MISDVPSMPRAAMVSRQPVGERLARKRARRLRNEQAQRLAFHLVAGEQVQHALHHLPVELDDAAGQFRRRHGLCGGHQGAVCLAHAQEHLVLGQIAAGNRHDGLVRKLQVGIQERYAFLVIGGGGRNVGGNSLRLQARLQRCAFGGFQGAAGVRERVRQRCIPHGASQAQGFLIAHREFMQAQFPAQALREFGHRFRIQALGQGQETVVVESGQGMRRGRKRQLASRFGHQLLEIRVAVALAQAQGAADLEEEQAAGGLFLQGIAQLLHQIGARGQSGFGIDGQIARRGLRAGAGVTAVCDWKPRRSGGADESVW